MLVKSQPESPTRKPRLQFFEPVSLFRRWFNPAPNAIAHAGTLVDIFASFVSLDKTVDSTEAEVALDLLRHAYPEADHGWLARRLQRAFRSPQTTREIADKIKEEMDADSIIALGLQLYLLVESSKNKNRGQEAFDELMAMIDQEALADSIFAEMNDDYLEEPPFTRVVFEPNASADVQLPPEAELYAFRLYRSGPITILRNTGSHTLWLGGNAVLQGQQVRLRSHQRLTLPTWTLTADDLSFFLTAQQQNETRSLYLHEASDGLTVERSRSRQSSIKITFGIKAIISVIRHSDLTLDGQIFLENTPVVLALHEKITLSDGKQVSLDYLRRQAMEAGGRFKLDEGEQTVMASNDPTVLQKGDLLLSPGLAGRVLLKIKFDTATSQGELEVIESERAVFINNQPVRQTSTLNDGMLIRLSASQGIRCRFTEGIIDEERTVIRELRLDSISHEFKDDEPALDNIDLTINRGEMLCIIGPSGCGKSTLLATLAGQRKPMRGHVRLNGISLYIHRERLAPFITFMPQEEALNANLTVREHLEHACSIRRPHLTRKEHSKRVEGILGELALQPLAHRKIGSPGDKSISGGERGRLNLGLDLGSAAEILLFDEPISGLSSKDSEHVAETLKAVSQDKIVIASLHRPGNSVLSLFDKVLLLDKGGRVAFYGTSSQMFQYFRLACTELGIPMRTRPP